MTDTLAYSASAPGHGRPLLSPEGLKERGCGPQKWTVPQRPGHSRGSVSLPGPARPLPVVVHLQPHGGQPVIQN